MFDYSKLRGKIAEVFTTHRAFSRAIGISEHTISLKLAGKREFTQGEIFKCCDLLHISLKEIPNYFFTH